MSFKMTAEYQKKIDELIMDAIDYFMIPPHIQIHVAVQEELKKDGDQTQDGQTMFDLQYLRARITLLSSQLEREDELIETIGHEVAHVLIGLNFYPLGTSLYAQYPDAEWIKASFNLADEQMATMLGRQFKRDYSYSKQLEKKQSKRKC